MFECFLEIGFEAELNTKEDPELMEIAYEQCKENLATRATAITELRKMIFGEFSNVYQKWYYNIHCFVSIIAESHDVQWFSCEFVQSLFMYFPDSGVF